MVNDRENSSALDRYKQYRQQKEQQQAARQAAQQKLGLIDRAINLQRQHPELDTPENRAVVLSERQKLLEATRKQGEVGVGEFFKTQYDLRQSIPFVPTGDTTQLIFRVLPVVRKVKNNKPLTLDEELLLQDYYNEIETEGERGRTMLAMAADIVATMPAYMGEFAVGKALVGTAAKKATEAAIKSIVKSYAKKGFGKYAIKAAGTLASGAAMAGTVGAMGAVESGARHYTTTDSGWARSAYQGFVDQWAEMTGEQVGGAMSSVFGKVTKKIIPPTSTLGKNLAKMSNSALGKRAEQWAQKVGYNGTIEEMGEERFSDMMRAVLGVGEWSDVIPDKKQIGAEAIGFAVPGVARATLGVIGGRGKVDIEGQPIKQPKVKQKDDGSLEITADTVEEAQQQAKAIDDSIIAAGENAKVIQEGTKITVKPVKPIEELPALQERTSKQEIPFQQDAKPQSEIQEPTINKDELQKPIDKEGLQVEQMQQQQPKQEVKSEIAVPKPAPVKTEATRDVAETTAAEIDPIAQAEREAIQLEDQLDAEIDDFFEGLDVETEAEAALTIDTTRSPHEAIANQASEMLNNKQAMNNRTVVELGKTHLGGIAGRTREVYDSIEAGLNLHLRNSNIVDYDNPEKTIEQLLEVTEQLPRQNTRNEQQVELQQFSTPPAEAFVATYVADIKKGERVIEPSAGTGNLATMAQIAGANVDTNEIDTLRSDLLKMLGFNVTNYDAEQLDNLLPDNKIYDVVVMNPPFSATGGRVKGHNTKFGARHVEQALLRLRPGGRLVAIVGNGMAFGRPNFEGWWNNIRSKYNVLANVGIDGNFYGKYGTTFDNNIIVIEKPLSRDGLINKPLKDIIQGEKLSPIQAVERLKPLRNRKIQNDTQTNQSESKSRNAETGSELQLPPVQRGDTSTDMGDRGRSDSGRAGGIQTGMDRERPATGRDGGMAGYSTDTQAGSAKAHTEGVSERSNIERQQTGISDSGRSISGTRSATSDGQSTKSGLDSRVEAKEQYSTDNTASETETSGFVSYKVRKAKIKNSSSHPTALVETAAASSVELPDPKVELQLPQEVITEGRLSDAQLEAVVMATQSFETTLPDGSTQGFWIGDGTGVGKGREIFGCIYEQLQRGKKRAVHISIASQLAEDSKRDMDAVGVPMDFIKQSDFKVNSEIIDKDGVLFTTYSLASKDYKKDKARFNQLIKWLGTDFDGVIALDEVHKAKNAATDAFGKTSTDKGTDTGAMVLELQNTFPKAKIMYVTATGASEVRHLAPFKRLGLWGKGAPFENFIAFSERMNNSGVAAMEMLQRDLKATGKFMARTISYEGVVNNPLMHNMTTAEKKHYDKLASVWQNLLVTFDEAAKNANDKSKGWLSQFYNTQQRFFLQLMMGYEMQDLISSIDNDLKDGKSVVISLLNTGETYLKDAKAAQINNKLEELDLSYRQMLVNLIERQFPVEQYEEYTDPDTGSTKTRRTGIINRENLRKRKELIDQVAEIELPNNALDVLIEHYGVDKVAEITGRSIRVENGKIKNRKIPGVKKSDLNAYETEQFQEGKKRIAVISGAASTGISLHSDKGKKNQQKRVLYAFQLSWSADVQMQIFGRVHRSFQANAPEIRIVTLDLAGQKRLVSAISKRLASLGALTKGDRTSLSGDMFQAEDITDAYGKAALRALYSQLDKSTLKAMNLLNKEGNINSSKEDDVSTFLNRIMVLPVDTQNDVFNQFYEYYQQNVEAAKQKELFDFGVEEIKAANIETKQSTTINVDEASGAKTVLNTVVGEVKVDKLSFQQADKNANGFFRNKISKEVYAAVRHEDLVSNKPYYRLHNVTSAHRVEYNELREKFDEVNRSEANLLWDKKYSETADTKEREYHILSGAVFPIYNQLFSSNEKNIKVKRANLANGKQIIGLHLTPKQAAVMQARVSQAEDLGSMSIEGVIGLLEAGSTIGVANGWFLEKSTIRGEDVIEIVRTESIEAPQGFREYNFIDEMINYRKRWFAPMENANTVLSNLFDTYKPISKTEVTDSDTGTKKIKAFGGSLGSPAKQRAEALEDVPAEFKLSENQINLIRSVANLDTKSQRIARIAMEAIAKMPKGISKADIVGFVRKAFGIPIKGYGTKRSRVRFGEYDTKGRIIRTKNTRDIGNILHEVGHAIDWGILNRWSKNPPNQEIANELTEIGKDLYAGLPTPEGGYKSEGFAEFIAMYIDNSLDGKAFATQEWFRNTFALENPTVYDNIRTARMLWNTYKKQGAERRIKAFMGEEKAAGINKTLNRGLFSSIAEWYRRTIDDGYPLKKLVDFYYSQGGELLADKDNPFLLYSLRRGTVNGTTESFLFSNTTDITGINDTGMSLTDAYSIALKGENAQAESDFDEYLILLRADELEARGIKSGINYKDISARIERLTEQYGDKFSKAAKEVHAWNDRLLEYAVEAGLFTREQKNQIVKDNTAYVPFHRVFEQDELARRSGGTGKGLSAVSPVKRIKGSDRGVQNIRKTMAQNAHKIITAAHKAEISNALVKLAGQSGMAEWIEKMPAPMEAVKLNPDQISKKVGAVLEEYGIDEQDVIADILKNQDYNNDMWTAFQPAMIYKGNDYIISLRIDGKQQWYRVHKELYEPINGIEGYRLPPIADKLFGIPTRMLRLFATGINLPFAITNFIHDAGFFLGSTKNTPNPLRLFQGVASDLKGDDMARAYKALGLELSGYIGQDKAAFDVAERIVKKARGKTFIYYAGGIANPLHMGRVIGLIRKAVGITESGVRIAEFKSSYEKYLKENGGDKYSAAVRAGVDAKDVTVDFTRGSRGLRFANQLIAFTNARLQGYDKLWRLFKEKPVQTTARYALIYSLPALLLWWKYKDDEWFSNMSDWEKTNYLHLQISDDVVLRIPRNREQGQLFGALAVAIMDSAYKQDPESVKRYVKTIANENDWHDITPTAVLPLIEAFIANENFMNVPIEPDWMQYRLPQDRYYEHTTEIAKNASKSLKAIGITASPLQIEHLLNGYFAGAYRSLSRLPEIDRGRDLPVASKFTMREPSRPTQQMNDFYDRKDQLQQKKGSGKTTAQEERVLKVYNKITYRVQQYNKQLKDEKDPVKRRQLYRKMRKLLEQAQEIDRRTTGSAK